MTFYESIKEFLKHMAAKTVQVVGTVIISEGLMTPIVNYIWNPSPEAGLVFKATVYYIAYKAFKDGVVPVVDEAYNNIKPASKGTGARSTSAYFA